MAIISTNGSFGSTDTVTSTNLNSIADGATFSDPADESSIELITSGGNAGKLGIKDGGVTATKYDDLSIAGGKIANDAINNAKIADGAVNTENIQTGAVTFAKIQNVAGNTVVVRNASSTGDLTAFTVSNQEILIGDGTGFQSQKLSGDVTMNNVGEVTISNNSITAAMLLKSSVMAAIYPVGSLYMNANVSTNPATLLGMGTWEQFGRGRVIVSQSTDSRFNSVRETGGSYSHVLTDSQVPVRDHKHFVFRNGEVPFGIGAVTSSTATASYGHDGSESYNARKSASSFQAPNVGLTSDPTTSPTASAHNNIQPYIVAYVWRRTA